MSSEQFEFKVIQKNVTAESTVQLQNDTVSDLRTSLSGIRLELTNFEKSMKFLFDKLLNVILKVDETENVLSNLKNSIQKEVDRITEAELREAAMEGTISAEQLDSKVMQKNFSTETVCVHYDLLDFVTGFFYIQLEIKTFQESMKELKNVHQEVKEKLAPAEEKLSTLASCIRKQLDHFLVDEISEAAQEETLSVEKFDSEDMLKNTTTKETVQKQKDTVAIILNDFNDIRKEITNFENFFEESVALLQNIERKISEDKKIVSTLAKSGELLRVFRPISLV